MGLGENKMNKPKISFVEFVEDFKNNITACFGCETIIRFEDLWYGEYCSKPCKVCYEVEA